MKSFLKKGAGLARRLLRDEAPRRYKPDLSDAAFLNRLDGAFRQSLPGGGDASLPIVRAAIIQHFSNRTAPAFFIEPGEVEAAIRRIAEDYPQWQAALEDRVAAELSQGLWVYDVLGPPSEQAFQRQGGEALADSAASDNLYLFKVLRLAFLPRLCIAVCHGSVSVDHLETVLRAFSAACEHEEMRFGYPTELVVTQRAIALSWCLVFLLSLNAGRDGESDVIDNALWLTLKILFSDIDFLSADIGHSTANNHLLVDGFAGWYLGSLFPEAKGAAAFCAAGEAIWLAELERQIYGDGGSFEHSAHYHEMACEIALAYYLLKQRNKQELPNGFPEKLRAMLSLQAAVSGPEAEPLPLGDAVEDPMFPLDAAEGWATGALRAALNALFPGAVAAARDDCPSLQRAFWLFGGALPSEEPSSEEPVHRAFPEAGLYVIEDRELATRFVFRSGPQPGARQWAGHMHADFLSLFISVGGQPLLVDAGTYSYRHRPGDDLGDAESWRTYFMGPLAHNTLSLTGHDPLGSFDGDFRSKEAAAAAVAMTRYRHEEGVTWLEGALEGVPQLEGYRRGLIHMPGAYALLYDYFTGSLPSEHCLLSFQCAPGTDLEQDDRSLRVTVNGVSATLFLDPQLRLKALLNGSMSPIGGWVSPSYGVIERAPQVRLEWEAVAPITAVAIAISQGDAVAERVNVVAGQDKLHGPFVEVDRGVAKDRFAVATGDWTVIAAGA